MYPGTTGVEGRVPQEVSTASPIGVAMILHLIVIPHFLSGLDSMEQHPASFLICFTVSIGKLS
jgi:hypothetical protein